MMKRFAVQSLSSSSSALAAGSRDALGRAFAAALAWVRGDAGALSDRDVSRIISFARISLVVGLVFLHYGSYPNSRISPFRGIDVHEHPLATGINSFVLFSFFMRCSPARIGAWRGAAPGALHVDRHSIKAS